MLGIRTRGRPISFGKRSVTEIRLETIAIDYKDIPCQLTPFLAFFGRPYPILLKFSMFVGLDEEMSHTKFQVSKLNSF